MNENRYQVVEDNGGGLHLIVLRNSKAIYAHVG